MFKAIFKKKVGLIIFVLALTVFVSGCVKTNEKEEANKEVIKIGVITALTGDVAYLGESSIIGVKLAKKDLANENINVEFIIEDGQLDPKMALNAAQKLVNINKVDAIYSEFNPAAVSVTSFVKDKNILHIYEAASVSPLRESDNIYKTYLDYEASCQEVAQLVKNRGIDKVGVLKFNLEFGNLCLKGIKNVYGNNVFSENYNAGTTDFRTLLTKLKTNNIQAVFNISFQPEALASIKNIRELGMDTVFIGVSDMVSPEIIDEYTNLLEGSIMFGLPAVSGDFAERLKKEFPDKTISNYQYATLAYIHSKQIATAFNKCGKDLECIRNEMDNSKNEPSIGFTGFKNHIAEFDVLIQEWKNGKFIDIKK